MRPGKLSELILKRSVLKKISSKRKEVVVGAKAGQDAAVLNMGPLQVVHMAAGSDFSFMPEVAKESEHYEDFVLLNGRLVMIKAINSVAAGFGKPVAVTVAITYPVDTEEKFIKKIMDTLEKTAAEFHIQIAGGHSEVSAYVERPIFSVTAYGYRKQMVEKEKTIGYDIVMSKRMAMEGTALLALLQRETLNERFDELYVKQAEDYMNTLSVTQEADIGERCGVKAMHDVSETGIFGALWELAEQLNAGIEVNLKKINVNQETIEFTEYMEINPYTMPSQGALLMVAEDGVHLVNELEKSGVEAAIIGKVTENNDKVVLNNEERRFLEQPR